GVALAGRGGVRGAGHAGEVSEAEAEAAVAPLVERLVRILPQTQCGQCGFDGCRPYAAAMARGEAGPDRCPPGGDAGARALARLLRVPAVPYDRARGEHKPPQVALRSEEHTSELQSREKLVCRLLLEKKKKI